MSPPCQPFTRNGLKLDDADQRSSSFLYLLEKVFPKLPVPPENIILENVKGFEESRTHEQLESYLKKFNYQFFEFLLSPIDLGIPYQRTRYFMVATTRKDNLKIDEFPILKSHLLISEPSAKICKVEPVRKVLAEYLEENPSAEYRLTKKFTEKHLQVLDIVSKTSEKCLCFTRAYSRFAKGSGSIINFDENAKLDSEERDPSRDPRNPEKYENLRFFTTRLFEGKFKAKSMFTSL